MKNKLVLTAMFLGLSCPTTYATDIIRAGIFLTGAMIAAPIIRIKCGAEEDSTNATEIPTAYRNLAVYSIQQVKSANSGQLLKVAGELVLQEKIDAFSDEHKLKDQENTLNIKLSSDIACHHNGGVPYDGEELYLYGKKNSQGGLDVEYWEAQYPLIRQSWHYSTEYDYPSFEILKQTAQYDEAMYAQFLLGKAYYEGKLTTKDNSKALQWATKAFRSELNLDSNYFSATLLGLLYAEKKEFKQAKVFLTKSYEYLRRNSKAKEISELEEFYGKAIYTLGMLYYEGNGVAKDLDMAMMLFKMVMDSEKYGMKYAPAEEIFRKLYAEKHKTPYSKDNIHIANYFNIALQKYKQKDPAALELFEKLGNAGDTNSQTMAGLMYYEGEIVPENMAKAKEWYLKAVEYKHPLAAYNLANVYDYENNKKKAKYYYQKSCEWGQKEGCEMVKKLK